MEKIKQFIIKYKIIIILSITILFLVILLIISLIFGNFNQKDKIIYKTKTIEEKLNLIKVDVKGEVKQPGVYQIEEKERVIDAITKAGGLTLKADTTLLNLSKTLKNEMVIVVYSKEEVQTKQKNNECPKTNSACIEEKDYNKSILEEEKEENNIVNINSDDITKLQTLTGIGESKAKSIIEYREKNGAFKTIEDIKKVTGIGDSMYEKIKDNITV